MGTRNMDKINNCAQKHTNAKVCKILKQLQAMDIKVLKCINNMCMCDHLHRVMPKKSYINSVIAGMVVRAAVN